MVNLILDKHVLDFDDIVSWAPSLGEELRWHITDDIYHLVSSLKPKYVEDALEVLLEKIDEKNPIIQSTLRWIKSFNVIGFHGTRLTKKDLTSILSNGLVPLRAKDRRERLIRALSKHPDWPLVAGQLDEVIDVHGNGNRTGHREGQVHLTLSKAGLMTSFNQYLTHGSEFDQHVAYDLLGQRGKDILTQDGDPILFRLAIPGQRALEAAHPYGTIGDVYSYGELPNIVREFLTAWAYYIIDKSFRPKELKVDCGMVFKSVVPAEWILDHKTVVL